MKIYLVIMLVFSSFLSSAQAQYSISFRSIEGQTINLSDYAGKKLLIVVCNAASPDTAQLRRLDSLSQMNDSVLSLLTLPVDDFGTPPEDSVLSYYFRDSLHLHGTIAQTGKGSKSNEEDQQPLLKWLTHVTDNNHFDNDMIQDGQIYLIDETGRLYAQFGKATGIHFLSKVIK